MRIGWRVVKIFAEGLAIRHQIFFYNIDFGYTLYKIYLYISYIEFIRLHKWTQRKVDVPNTEAGAGIRSAVMK